MLNGSPVASLEARMTGNLPSLSPKLKQVAAYCLQHARHLHLCRIQDIAQHCDTQPVTVVRLAKRYGFRGFLDFKMAFLADAGQSASTTPALSLGLETDWHVDMNHHRAVHLLQRAHTVWVHAVQETAQIAHCYADMLRVAGLTVQWMCLPMEAQPNRWEGMEHDVLLSLSLMSDAGGDFDAVCMAQRLGIPVIAVTDDLNGCTSSAADAHVCVANLAQGLHGISAGLALAQAVHDARLSTQRHVPSPLRTN